MKKFIITQEQGNDILNYLTTKPYVEVFQLVAILTNGLETYEEPAVSVEGEIITPPTQTNKKK